MAAKNEFSMRKIVTRPKFKKKKKKNTFPIEFFNEIWLKVGEHKYLFIFEIKFGKTYSV